MKKIILKLDLHDGKEKQKAMKTVSALSGIDSISMDMKEKKLTVIGAVDAITITSKLRKYWPTTDIIFVGPAKEPEKPAEKKEEGKKEDGKKEDEKKEGGEEKKEGEKKEGGDEAKKEGGDDKKKDEKKAPVPVPVYDPMWEMMKRGYNPQMFGYNPQMSYYNPYVANSYNPHMASYNPPQMTTHYVQSVDENPNICTIC